MKRIVSFALILILVLCMVPVSSTAAEADLGMRPLGSGETYQKMSVSDDMITMIMDMEGFSATPYEDHTQWSIGYGSCLSTDLDEDVSGVTWTQAQAEERLISDVNGTYGTTVNDFCKKIGRQPSQQQFDALVSFTYNVGGNWTSGCRLSRWLENPTTLDELMNSMGIWCRASGKINYTLCCRRVREIIVYLHGEYTLQNGKVTGAVAGQDTDLEVVSNGALPYIKFIVYQANGGSFDSDVSTYQDYVHYYEVGSSGIKPFEVTKEGYYLSGWTITREGNNKTTKGEAFTAGTVLNQNLEITAQWTDQPIEECNHDFATATTWNPVVDADGKPVCDENGYEKYTVDATLTCAVCGEVYSVKGVEAEIESATAATCTEAGAVVYAAEIVVTDADGALLASFTDTKKVSVPAKGHREVTDAAVDATCTESGLTEGSHCADCGTVLVAQDMIPATGHNYVDGVCTGCGAEQMVAPAVPEILSCYSTKQTSVKVTWSLIVGADGYELWRTTDPDDDSSWTRAKTITGGTADRYTNQGLTEGVTYYYKVRAYVTDPDGEMIYSDFSEACYMPASVVWDAPYSNATFRVRLRWKEIEGAHGYQIWRQNDDGTWSVVKTLGDKGNELTDNQGATTAYSNTGLTAGAVYTYKMRAFMITEDGRKVFGAYSDEFAVAAMPEAPSWTVTNLQNDRVQISWSEVSGAAGYQIWMQDGEDGAWAIVKSISDGSTSYVKYDLTAGHTYNFKVRAYTEVDGKKTFGAYGEIVSVDVIE